MSLLIILYFAGFGFNAGFGSGGASSGHAVNTGIIAIQGDVSDGIIFRLK